MYQFQSPITSRSIGASCPRFHSFLKSHQKSHPLRSSSIASSNAESTTERIFRSIEERNESNSGALGAGGGTTLADLRRLDASWHTLRTKNTYGPRPEFVRKTFEPLPTTPGIDVTIAGGTLGIFLAAALQHAGLKVAIIERGTLQGRSQDWNISKKELLQFVELGVLTEEDVEDAISIEFNPIRVGFYGYDPIWTRDVLNLGVSPRKLIKAAERQFKKAGGVVLDQTSLQTIWIRPNGIELRIKPKASSSQTDETQEYALASKLLIDCMGNQSPIVRQIRHAQKPDGVCLVVGTCARGFDPEKNKTGDVIYTNAPSEPPRGSLSTPRTSSSVSSATATTMADAKLPLTDTQLFWEAFPSGESPTDRTTYMFTYMDASPSRPSFEQLLEHYWQTMPEYQNVRLDDLEIQRVLFGLFPTYRDSPLQTPYYDRILAVGDAGGGQSPLSFGGFAALTRHIHRLTFAVVDAVQADALDSRRLKFINAYNPSLSAAWMMQKAMSCPAGSASYDRNFINRLLGGNFKVMNEKGQGVLKPFLQDVIQIRPLTTTLLGQMMSDFFFVPQILLRVGPVVLADWLVHIFAMAGYSLFFYVAETSGLREKVLQLPPKEGYVLRRAIERWEYGAGLDYHDDE